MFTLHNPTKTEDLSGYFVTSHACPECNGTETVTITPDKLFAYNLGQLAQTVLSEYPVDVRERFISGYCDDCWNNLFGEEE